MGSGALAGNVIVTPRPAAYPSHAQPTTGAALSVTDAWRKRLLYRSRQRGWWVWAAGRERWPGEEARGGGRRVLSLALPAPVEQPHLQSRSRVWASSSLFRWC